MHKIKISGYFKNDDMNVVVKYDCLGEKEENKITFKNDNDTITIIDNNDLITFLRENEEICMTYEFSLDKNTANNSYKLKKENLEMNFEVKTRQITRENNRIVIDFNLHEMDGNCNYQLNIDYKVV